MQIKHMLKIAIEKYFYLYLFFERNIDKFYLTLFNKGKLFILLIVYFVH